MSLKSLKKVQIIFYQTTVILFKKIFIDNCISNSNKYKNCAIEDQTITVENYVIKSSGVEELLGVTIDSNLNVKEHILSLCKKANRKLHALSHVSKYTTLNKRRILMKSFIISQFNYCLINHMHERAFRIVYHDYSSSFEYLLNKD